MMAEMQPPKESDEGVVVNAREGVEDSSTRCSGSEGPSGPTRASDTTGAGCPPSAEGGGSTSGQSGTMQVDGESVVRSAAGRSMA